MPPIAVGFATLTVEPSAISSIRIATVRRSRRPAASSPVRAIGDAVDFAGGTFDVTLDEAERLAEALKRAAQNARKQGLR